MPETLSTRVPEEIREEIKDFMREEKLEKSAAVRKILRTGLEEWRKRKALELLEGGHVQQGSGNRRTRFMELCGSSQAKWLRLD